MRELEEHYREVVKGQSTSALISIIASSNHAETIIIGEREDGRIGVSQDAFHARLVCLMKSAADEINHRVPVSASEDASQARVRELTARVRELETALLEAAGFVTGTDADAGGLLSGLYRALVAKGVTKGCPQVFRNEKEIKT